MEDAFLNNSQQRQRKTGTHVGCGGLPDGRLKYVSRHLATFYETVISEAQPDTGEVSRAHVAATMYLHIFSR